MKKFIAICSVLFSVCTAFASCGDMNGASDTDKGYSTTDQRRDNSAEKAVKDAGDYAGGVVDGIEDAGEDIIDGAGDAAEDIIDGVDGGKAREKKNVKSTTTAKKR